MAADIRLEADVGVFTALSSAARTADTTSPIFNATGVEYRGAYFIIDVTAVTATPSVTFTIRGVDRVSGATFDILTSAAITGTGTTVLQIGPGITATANLDEDSYLPPMFDVFADHADADSITYSVGGILCP